MAKKSETKRTKWSTPQLQAYIKKESLDSSKVIFTEHAMVQMRKRKINMSCALEALRKGKINITPEMDFNSGDLKCRMEHYVAGCAVRVVVAISDDVPEVIVVTAI
jgi:hypothetical protein